MIVRSTSGEYPQANNADIRKLLISLIGIAAGPINFHALAHETYGSLGAGSKQTLAVLNELRADGRVGFNAHAGTFILVRPA
jgi:hypothetical protein